MQLIISSCYCYNIIFSRYCLFQNVERLMNLAKKFPVEVLYKKVSLVVFPVLLSAPFSLYVCLSKNKQSDAFLQKTQV